MEKVFRKPKWVAFFSDCLHSVAPVKSGYRVTVTYNILVNGGEKPAPPTLEAIPELKELVGRIEDFEQDTIGIYLTHRYPISGLSPENLKVQHLGDC